VNGELTFDISSAGNGNIGADKDAENIREQADILGGLLR